MEHVRQPGAILTGPAWHALPFPTFGCMKSREEQLTWAKQRALICLDMGDFACAVAGLRVDRAENPLTKGVISSEHAMRDELGDREFLVSSGLTLADISVATALRIWSRGVGHDLPATLKAYCERLQDRPACKRAMAADV